MLARLARWLCPVPEIPCWQLYLRLTWIVVQLGLGWCLAQRVNPFFYQGF